MPDDSEQAGMAEVLDGDAVPAGLDSPPVHPDDEAAAQEPVGEDDGTFVPGADT